MAVNQKDIAEKAQVSRSLVARVLNDDATIKVSHSKRQLILRTASELGYRPNLVARNLRKGKTHAVVAICLHDEDGTGGPFLEGVLETLAVEFAQSGYELKVQTFRNTADAAAAIEEVASASACDAFVLWLPNECGEQSAIAVQRRGMPFVITGYYDPDIHADWHQVDYDHVLMMRQAVQYLADAGNTRIAYFGFDTDQNFSNRLLSGYRSAVSEILGVPAVEEWIYRVTNDPRDTEAITEQWLNLPRGEQPTGVVVGAGVDAWIGVEMALARRGHRIGPEPGAINVVGQRLGRNPLLYGHGLGFDINQTHLARAAAKDLKRQLLAKGSPELVTRLVPTLSPIKSLCLPLPGGG